MADQVADVVADLADVVRMCHKRTWTLSLRLVRLSVGKARW